MRDGHFFIIDGFVDVVNTETIDGREVESIQKRVVIRDPFRAIHAEMTLEFVDRISEVMGIASRSQQTA